MRTGDMPPRSRVEFRFCEELNDFLAPTLTKRTIEFDSYYRNDYDDAEISGIAPRVAEHPDAGQRVLETRAR
jgi:hypothetical protein